MAKVLELAGMKFGFYTVIKRVPKPAHIKSTWKSSYWECVCRCGRVKHVEGSSLKDGRSKSCGCGREVFNKKGGLYKGYGRVSGYYMACLKHRAGNRHEIAVDAKFLWELFEKQGGKCALSGIPIVLRKSNRTEKSLEQTASLDRIDSSGGYTEDNVQWVHKIINHMKNRYSVDIFVEMCKLVAEKAA